MKNNDIIITIAGTLATGKSHLVFLLKKFLRENKFRISFDGDIDFKNEIQFDKNINKNFDKAIEVIKEKTTIILKEAQLINRDII